MILYDSYYMLFLPFSFLQLFIYSFIFYIVFQYIKLYLFIFLNSCAFSWGHSTEGALPALPGSAGVHTKAPQLWSGHSAVLVLVSAVAMPPDVGPGTIKQFPQSRAMPDVSVPVIVF